MCCGSSSGCESVPGTLSREAYAQLMTNIITDAFRAVAERLHHTPKFVPAEEPSPAFDQTVRTIAREEIAAALNNVAEAHDHMAATAGQIPPVAPLPPEPQPAAQGSPAPEPAP